jgi:hypothetical protein
MATAYSFKTLAHEHIRVLTIAGPDLPLQCTLVHVPIEDAGEYDALSYVWGSSDRTEFIICDGQRLDVTSNLHNALCHISKNRMPWTVWIDGVCIDQQNDEEKARQVGRMDTIYSSARCVLVWLGLAGDESDLAIQAIEDMVQVIEPVKFQIISTRDFSHLLLSTHQANALTTWSSIFKLYYRPWFRRLWIIQEAVLARELTLICGDKQISWYSFKTFTDAIMTIGPSIISASPILYSLQYDQLMFQGIGQINFIRRWPQKQAPLLGLLSIARQRQATDPRDRVYGMLGLVNGYVRSLFTIDYTQKPYIPYIQFGILSLQKTHTLGLLSTASSEHRPVGLPTWCPNFESSYPEILDFCDYKGFEAGFEPGGPRLSYVEVLEASNEIGVRGFHVDVVKRVVSSSYTESSSMGNLLGPEGDSAKNLSWMLECEALFLEITPDSVDVSEAYCRALVADHYGVEPIQVDVRQDYHNLKQELSAKSEYRVFSDLARDASNSITQYITAISLHRNRRLFHTRDGRIGLGPKDTKCGDLVCMLYGGRPLFLLRPVIEWPRFLLRPVLESTKFQLVGDVFVDGLMNLSTTKSKINWEDQTLTII